MKNWLKAERALHNLTQEEVARSLKISRQTVTAIETQDYFPSVALALKISRFFNRTVEEMFELEEEEIKEVVQLPVIRKR